MNSSATHMLCGLALAASAVAQVPAFVSKPGWPYISQRPLLADLDNDGEPEVLEAWYLSTNQPGVTLSYRKLLGNGEWALGASFTSPAFAQYTFHIARAAGDVNGDGNQDIFVGRTVGGAGAPGGPGLAPWLAQLWLGDGLGGLTDASQNLPPTLTNVQHAKFADFDGDGDLDLVLCDAARLLLWINDGTGHFSDQSSRRVENYATYAPWRCAVLDADQDGDLDVIVSNGWGTFQPTILYENNGHAMFKARSQGMNRIAELYVLDADGDGWDDVFAVYPTLATVFLSRPNQNLMTQAPQLLPPLPAGTVVYPPCFMLDADGDGDLDIVAYFGNSAFQFWQNTGSGFVVVLSAMPPTTGFTYVIDYDRDGDQDLLGGVPGAPGVVTCFSNTSREIVKLTEPIRGAAFTNDVYARANHLLAVGISTSYVRQPMASLGLLYLVPAQTVTVAILSFPTRGRQTVSVPIPNLPWLVGQLLCIQAVDLDLGSGTMHLTNAPSGLVQ